MADGLTQSNEIASKTWREQERYGAKPDGLTQTNGAKPDCLTQTNEIASKTQKEQERDGARSNRLLRDY